jgi:hypothetical protein
MYMSSSVYAVGCSYYKYLKKIFTVLFTKSCKYQCHEQHELHYGSSNTLYSLYLKFTILTLRHGNGQQSAKLTLCLMATLHTNKFRLTTKIRSKHSLFTKCAQIGINSTTIYLSQYISYAYFKVAVMFKMLFVSVFLLRNTQSKIYLITRVLCFILSLYYIKN